MAKKAQAIPAQPDPNPEPRLQAAALPWRRAANGVEVLLITSRETRRWVLPKGWPMRGLKPPQTAAREAFEEAGVKGEVAKKKIGDFHYEKRLRSGRVQRVRVGVYALRVDDEQEAWPEVEQREKLWTSPAEAAALVQEPELSDLLRAFAPA
jgi:8-oxo-dGTP pyrophosphatase MutT (NUDIX family)